jgi:hypothetical protein
MASETMGCYYGHILCWMQCYTACASDYQHCVCCCRDSPCRRVCIWPLPAACPPHTTSLQLCCRCRCGCCDEVWGCGTVGGQHVGRSTAEPCHRWPAAGELLLLLLPPLSRRYACKAYTT